MQTKLVLKQQSALRLRFQPGATGPAGTITIGTVTTGAPGSSVVITNTGTPENAILNITIPRGDTGLTGDKGWSPILALVADGSRIVVQISDWAGGQGTKPATGSYIGPSGLVPDIASAVDIRGPQGVPGTVADGDKGDIVVSGSGLTWTIKAKAVSNSKLADVANGTFKGRTSAGSGPPEDLTGTQATALLSAVVGDSGSGGTKGLAPAPAAGDAAALKVLGAGGGWVSTGIFGQCRLVKSGANIVLQPYSGNLLTIGGVNRPIPGAGVSLAPTGLTASTLYYVYAYMSGATMTLEASATGHATDSTTGVEIKSGDASRTLVGMVYIVAGPAFADTVTQRCVLSWFNQREVYGLSSFSAQRSTTSTSFVEVNSEIRISFLTWGPNAVHAQFDGTAYGTSGVALVTSIGFDGATAQDCSAFTNSSVATPVTVSIRNTLSEGLHYVTLIGRNNSAGTANWFVNSNAAGDRPSLKLSIFG